MGSWSEVELQQQRRGLSGRSSAGGAGVKAQGPPPHEKLLSENPRALPEGLSPLSRRADFTRSLSQSKAAFPR